MKRREYIISGKVQGVGYRSYAAQLAALHHITGFVENLSDGSVRIVAEGSDEELDLFSQGISASSEPIIQVSGIEETGLPYIGEFMSFSIRFLDQQQEMFARSGLIIEYLHELVTLQRLFLSSQQDLLIVMREQTEESVKRREVLERVIEAIHTQGLR